MKKKLDYIVFLITQIHIKEKISPYIQTLSVFFSNITLIFRRFMNVVKTEYIKKTFVFFVFLTLFLLYNSFFKDNILTIYVSAGSEGGIGTVEKPFGSLDEARLAIRNIGTRRSQYTSIVVEVEDGQYSLNSLIFEKKDGGTKICPIIYKANNSGKAILNGGVALEPSEFLHITNPDIISRLSEEAAENVVCLSLFDKGITADDYGKIGVIGSFHTAAQYDGDWILDQYCELFYNDRRMNIARYPNEGFITTESVISEGYGLESVNSNHAQREGWRETRNPESDVYLISQELSDRIASWKTINDVWMFGYWSYDWADASTPIGFFDEENRLLSPKFVALYGARNNPPFYFFNVLEELDTPGEWYLDRENGILYLYPEEDFENAEITLSISTDSLISSLNTKYLTLDGFVVEGTRGNGMEIKGDYITVSNCLVKNVGGDALLMNGSNNLAYNNEITRTGKGGIILEGGNTEKLIAGENIADNNLIHDWSEVYYTYCPAVTLSGVGNICRHNDIYNSPHTAISFSGNNHAIEYNIIHDVCKLSSDAGAIYSGIHWDWYGTKINYNYIYDIGKNRFSPNGIYLDDNLSGITVFGNVIVNVKGIGMQFGGGRDLDVENNLIVACGTSIDYDARAIEGTKDENYWYAFGLPYVWEVFYRSPWKTEIWQNAYPQMRRFTDDASDLDNPDFIPNPAYSVVINNVEYCCKKRVFSKEVLKLSNVVYYENPMKALESIINIIFVDPEDDDYHIRNGVNEIVFDDPDLQSIPFKNIGRQ